MTAGMAVTRQPLAAARPVRPRPLTATVRSAQPRRRRGSRAAARPPAPLTARSLPSPPARPGASSTRGTGAAPLRHGPARPRSTGAGDGGPGRATPGWCRRGELRPVRSPQPRQRFSRVVEAPARPGPAPSEGAQLLGAGARSSGTCALFTSCWPGCPLPFASTDAVPAAPCGDNVPRFSTCHRTCLLVPNLLETD